MTNTNLKALAEALIALRDALHFDMYRNIPCIDEAAALLTALAEPLGEEPARSDFSQDVIKTWNRIGDTRASAEQAFYVSAKYADYFRTAYLQARAENITLRSLAESAVFEHRESSKGIAAQEALRSYLLSAASKQER